MDIAALASTGGPAALLAVVIIYLLVANRVDRTQYQDLADRSEERAATAEAREATAQQKLDEERALRRKVEDEADVMRRKLAREQGSG